MQKISFRVKFGFKMRVWLYQIERLGENWALDSAPVETVRISIVDGGVPQKSRSKDEPYAPGSDWLITDNLPLIVGITENFSLEDASFPIIKNVNPTLYISDERFFNKPPTPVGVKRKHIDDPEPKVETPTGLIEE